MKQTTIKKRFAEAVNALGLTDWKFSLSWGDEPENHASTIPDPDSKHATVYFNLSSMQKETRAENADTIVHELLHVKLSPLTSIARKLLGKRGRKVIWSMEERLVNELVKMPILAGLIRHLAR